MDGTPNTKGSKTIHLTMSVIRRRIVAGLPAAYVGMLLVSLLTPVANVQAQAADFADVYRFDAVQSRIEVIVFSGGAFGIFGHEHTIAAKRFTGTISYDAARLEQSTVGLSIESKSLAVIDPNASEKDRREIQATMEGSRVLDVRSFPEISFQSTGLSNPKKTGQEWEGIVTGNLNLHGIERMVSFPVHISIEKDLLKARGEVFINQREFGMTPISVAGGTVRVKDRVKVSLNLVAARKRP